MADRPILIISDSRGRLLDYELNEILHDINFYHVWQGGLRLENSFNLVKSHVLNLKPKLIYFLNGICDITYVRTREPWSVALRNRSPTIACDNFMMTIDHLHANTFALSDHIGHFLMIIFSSQTGVDMGKYNGYPRDLISPEQLPLNKSIQLINHRISQMNRSMSIVTPFLSSATHQRCRGKYRFVSDKLIDGCHPTRELCKIWASKLRDNILTNISKYDHYALVNQMYRN